MDRFTAKEGTKAELLGCLYCLENSNCYSNMSCGEIYNALSKLRYYENLEEQGKIAILPCKIDDVVYKWGWKYSECHLGVTPQYRPCSECEGCCSNECDSIQTEWLYSGKVVAMRIDRDGILVQINWNDKWDTSWYNIGKTVFLTKEEAERALKR